jgi:hypothetical protein|tara:strand:+ start:20379 stop:20954 length:576 start_codon:yes stop_codon:yes gene_type:complete
MSDPASKVDSRPIESLVPYDRNPRMHPDSQIEQLANSIRQWGWTVPILIDDASNVIAGHGRLEAAKRLGMEAVPCVVASGWTEDQRRAYVIADNKLSENSAWDDGLFYRELTALSEANFDLSLTGVEGFEVVDFQPNVDPSFSPYNVDDVSLDRASDNMTSQINGIQNGKAEQGTEVMCPHCAETFIFTGS